jgi:tetratricopeptide (TPR) repeat protein
VVRSWTRWEGDTLLQASLFRDYRVEGLAITCRFEHGVELDATVALLPLIETPSPEDHAEELYHLAVAAFTGDQEGEAVALLERAIAVCPTHADSYESLGVILGRHGRYDEAIQLMRRLVDVDPDSVMAHTNMSVYYNQLGRIEDAEREARAAAVKGLELQRREQERADAERRARAEWDADLERRKAMFLEVLELDSADALGNFGMGELCVETGRFEDAVQHLERAIEADQDYSAAYLALGRAWEGMRQVERAREVYTAGVEVSARRGDLATANKMQSRLQSLEAETG